LLENPVTNFGFDTTAHNGEWKEITIAHTSDIGKDLGLAGNDVLKIKATEWDTPVTDPNWTNGKYKVSARFSS
jgi:hypothetical protein